MKLIEYLSFAVMALSESAKVLLNSKQQFLRFHSSNSQILV